MIRWYWDDRRLMWARYTIEDGIIRYIHYLPVVVGKTNIPPVARKRGNIGIVPR